MLLSNFTSQPLRKIIQLSQQNSQNFQTMNCTVAPRRRTTTTTMAVAVLVITLMLLVTPTSPTCHPSPPSHRPSPSPRRGGSWCKQCVVEQLQFGCPKCTPILRCMGRCLWGGAAKSKCVQKCNCGGGKPTLADCKGCMSRCKCSCL